MSTVNINFNCFCSLKAEYIKGMNVSITFWDAHRHRRVLHLLSHKTRSLAGGWLPQPLCLWVVTGAGWGRWGEMKVFLGCPPEMWCQRERDGIHFVGRWRSPRPYASQLGIKLHDMSFLMLHSSFSLKNALKSIGFKPNISNHVTYIWVIRLRNNLQTKLRYQYFFSHIFLINNLSNVIYASIHVLSLLILYSGSRSAGAYPVIFFFF